PSFTFNGQYSGSAPADFLLGLVQTASTSQQQNDTIEQRIYQGYVQDDWKVTTKLVLNLGLRYEVTTPFDEEYDRQSNFVLESGPCHLQLVLAKNAERCGVNRTFVRTDYNNFAPRAGLAYQLTKRTVIRAGSGVFYGRDEDLGIARRLPNNPPFVTSATFTGD